MLTPPPNLPPIKGLPGMKYVFKWLNDLRDYVASLGPMSSHNVRVYHTARGTSWVANESETVPDTSPQAYKLVKVWDDYLECTLIDDDGQTYYLAKPHGLRKTPWAGQVVDGITYTFPDAADSTKRTAAKAGSANESQRIVPYYVAGFSILFAVMADIEQDIEAQTDPLDPTATELVTLMELNLDARAWAKV